jgi:hypothetical protein
MYVPFLVNCWELNLSPRSVEFIGSGRARTPASALEVTGGGRSLPTAPAGIPKGGKVHEKHITSMHRTLYIVRPPKMYLFARQFVESPGDVPPANRDTAAGKAATRFIRFDNLF